MTPTDANHDKDLEDSFRVWFERTPLPEAPETLHQSLRRAVEERRPSRPQPRWRPLVAATLAGALALVLLIVSGFDERLWNPGPVPNDGGVSTPQVTPGATPLSQASAPPIVSAAGLVD